MRERSKATGTRRRVRTRSAAELRASLTPTSAPERRRFKAEVDGIVEKHVGAAFNEMFAHAAQRRCRSVLDLGNWFVNSLTDHADRYAAAIPHRRRKAS
jgi:hypothetical protein